MNTRIVTGITGVVSVISYKLIELVTESILE